MNRKTSIIILTYNHLNYTKACIESIKKYTETGTYELLIVDNASSDGTREWLKTQKNIKCILNEENQGFPKGCNQGIQMASGENDILLLNNDTIVTENWLTNLKICLHSSTQIGAVGPICNQNENRQGAPFSYQDFETMQQLASKNNVSNPNLWEEKVFLIGYCLLIKREVMEQLQQLDEAFTPGYIEDNDLSLRILKLGYKLMLCHDSFIHHYLGTAFREDLSKFYPILKKNRQYFLKKWKFDTFSFDAVKQASFPLLENPKRVLELDCGIGTTILALQYQWKEIVVEGTCTERAKRNFSSLFTKVYSSLKEIPENYYDTILVGNALEMVKNPASFLRKLKKYLKEEGAILGEFQNAVSIQSVQKLLTENVSFFLAHEKNMYTKKDMKILLTLAGYKNISFFSWYQTKTMEEENLFQQIGSKNQELSYTYYTFKAYK